MAGDFERWSPESRDLMGMLKDLSREEILEVLSEGLYPHCEDVIEARVNNLNQKSSAEFLHGDSSDDVISPKRKLNTDAHTPSPRVGESTYSGRAKRFVTVLSTSVNSKQPVFNHSNFKIKLNDGPSRSVVGNGLLEEQNEFIRFRRVGRRKDFVHYEKVNVKEINVLKGLEHHTQVFNPDEQREIIECVYTLQRMGQKRQLRERTYSEPRKWMKGKGPCHYTVWLLL